MIQLSDLGEGEVRLLVDALSEDVPAVWVLIQLGIRDNPPPTGWIASSEDLDRAAIVLRRLLDLGLIEVGRVETVDGRPFGRDVPNRFVAERLDSATDRAKVGLSNHAWEWAYFVVLTSLGETLASQAANA